MLGSSAPHGDPSRRSGRSRAAVLSLHAGCVTWTEASCAPSGVSAALDRAATGLEEPSALVDAACTARALAGSTTRDVVLALGEPFVSLRLLTLPALAASELRAVQRRKAAAACGVGLDEVAYVARSFRPRGAGSRHADGTRALVADTARGAGANVGPEDSAHGGGHRHLIAATESARLEAFVAALRRQGLRVRRVVVARLALLAGALEVSTSGGVKLVLQRDADGAALWLCDGDEVIHETALTAGSSAAADASLCTSLVQEAKSCAAFTRRMLRGEALDAFRLDGFEPALAERLELALTSALHGARCERADGEPGRSELLTRGCAPQHAREVDLGDAGARRGRRTALLVSLACAAMLAVVAVTRGSSSDDDAFPGPGAKLPRNARHGLRADEARALGERLARIEDELAHLAQRKEQTRAFGALVDEIWRGAGSDVAILSAEGALAGPWTIEGAVDARPLAALDALSRVRRRWASSGLECGDVEPLDSGAAAPGIAHGAEPSSDRADASGLDRSPALDGPSGTRASAGDRVRVQLWRAP